MVYTLTVPYVSHVRIRLFTTVNLNTYVVPLQNLFRKMQRPRLFEVNCTVTNSVSGCHRSNISYELHGRCPDSLSDRLEKVLESQIHHFLDKNRIVPVFS